MQGQSFHLGGRSALLSMMSTCGHAFSTRRTVPIEQVSESRLSDLKKETVQLEEELEQTRYGSCMCSPFYSVNDDRR